MCRYGWVASTVAYCVGVSHLLCSSPQPPSSMYDQRPDSASSGGSSASWANNNNARQGRLLYAPLILVDENRGMQPVWNADGSGSASLPASARAGWQTGTPGLMPPGPSRAYSTLRAPTQLSSGYVEKGSADSLVESVNTNSIFIEIKMNELVSVNKDHI